MLDVFPGSEILAKKRSFRKWMLNFGRCPFDQIFRLKFGVFHGRMEQYFPVGWTNQSQVITEDSYLCLLALGLLDDSEIEINDVFGEGDNILFIKGR